MSVFQNHEPETRRRTDQPRTSIALTLVTFFLYSCLFGLLGVSVVHDLRNGDSPAESLFER